MICPNCKKEVMRVTTRFHEGKLIDECSECRTASPAHYPIYDSTNGYSISVAHRDDIRSRHVNPDGSITRRK